MSAIAGASTVNPPSPTDAFSAFTSGEFLQIIFAELTNQDPLSPNETKDLINQIATIRSIESDTALIQKFDDLIRQNDLTVSSSLIGKFVTGLDEFDTPAASFVDSVSITRFGTVLNLSSGARVPLDQVDEVIDPDLISLTRPEDDAAADDGSAEAPTGMPDETGQPEN